MSGLFVMSGKTVSIPVGGLSISVSDAGKPIARSIRVQVHYDVCPTWLSLAGSHLVDAKRFKAERLVAWSSNDEEAKASTLEREFEASMQAVMASAIAIDSFYASLKDKTTLSKEEVDRWREKGTARYKQIAEVMRRAFCLKPRVCAQLRKNLHSIFRARDMAVHPSGDVSDLIFHPELGVAVEWRFMAFRTDNAEAIVKGTWEIFSELLNSGNPATPEIKAYASGLTIQIESFDQLVRSFASSVD